MNEQMPSRLLAISDIHGHGDGLLLLLEQAEYRAGVDRLILLGDYVNEDSDSWDTLLTIKKLTDQGALALPGNMELHLAGIANSNMRYMQLVQWIEALPFYIVEDNFLFVHAGIRPGLPLELQSSADLTEIREAFWHEETGLPYTIVFGHTPTFKLGNPPGLIWYGNNRLGIDTGAKHGHRLTLLDLSGGKSYSCSTAPQFLYEDIRIESVSNRFMKRK